MKKIWKNNSLSITFFLLFLVAMVGQAVTGFKEYNEELAAMGGQPLQFSAYLLSGHFIEATFENWESEFLQMALFVVLSVSLFQKGSSESKDPDEEEEVDKEPDPGKKDAPWPVKKGGLWLGLYKQSLSLVLFLLFFLSFLLHWYGSLKEYNVEQTINGKPRESALQYLGNAKFWAESFQNWQSEFLSVFAIIVLTVFLRQKGSPQSKPVDAPDAQTG